MKGNNRHGSGTAIKTFAEDIRNHYSQCRLFHWIRHCFTVDASRSSSTSTAQQRAIIDCPIVCGVRLVFESHVFVFTIGEQQMG